MTDRRPWCSVGLAERPLQDVSWLAFDLETDGLHPGRHDIRELAAFLISPVGTITEIAQWRVADQDGAARTLGLEAMATCIRHGAALVAHNIAFDLAFLAVGEETPSDLLRPAAWMCTFRLRSEPRRLDALAEGLGVTIEGRHTARGDARALADILVALHRRAEEDDVEDVGGMVALATPAGDPPGATPPATEFDVGWASVRAALDHVVPVPLTTADQRRVLVSASRLLERPILGPSHPVELEALVSALRGVALTATGLDTCLPELASLPVYSDT